MIPYTQICIFWLVIAVSLAIGAVLLVGSAPGVALIIAGLSGCAFMVLIMFSLYGRDSDDEAG